MSELMRVRAGTFEGKDDLFLDVLIAGDPAAVGKLQGLGATVRTVTSSEIMTANVPLSRVRAIAALEEVTRVEASRSVKLYNDVSNGVEATPEGLRVGMANPRSTTGAGVVVGILDTGIDWTHGDFVIDASKGTGAPRTRVRFYWDQSDRADDRPPTGFTIGREYTAADIEDALANYDNSWDPATNAFGPLAEGYPIRASARDVDGHGTHVAGTAAGDGSASGRMGAAPDADLVVVKFDFDGDRNTDANIVDGINYIFQRAAELGKPAVINLSLGTDYGPHDGSTLEERGIDDLAGPGRVVVVAAGNPGGGELVAAAPRGVRAARGGGARRGVHVPLPDLRWLDRRRLRVLRPVVPGREQVPGAGDDAVRGDVPAGEREAGVGDRERLQRLQHARGGDPGPERRRPAGVGVERVGHRGVHRGLRSCSSGLPFAGSSGSDIAAYIEVSDYWGTAPATGIWTFTLAPADARSTCAGSYHTWHGVSESVVQGLRAEPTRDPTPRFGGRESDNRVTISNPASADEVIAAAAYMSRDAWSFAYGVQEGMMCLADSAPEVQRYNEGLLSYYDPFAVGELANFSARGPRRDGVLKPEVATPGVGIASALSHFTRHAEWEDRCMSYFDGGPYHYGTNRVLPGDEAAVLQGTSMACPNATGAIAALLEAKGDLDDRCLRRVLAATAAHDPATDVFQDEPFSARTDTDMAAGAGKPNNDWGHGKMDVGAALGFLGGYSACTAGCLEDAGCGAGFKCARPEDPCACGSCEACAPAKATCTSDAECCSGVCSGKRRKTCE